MPPLPVVPNVIKIIHSSTRSDSPVENILHMKYSGSAPASADLGTFMGGTYGPAWDTVFVDEASTDATMVQIEMLDLSSSTGAQDILIDTSAGGRTGDFAPSSACVLASWGVNRRFRGGHPRSYFPFGTAGTYASGSSKFWDPAFIADVQTKLETFIGLIQGTTVGTTVFENLVNVSYYDIALNPTPPYRRTTPLVDDITTLDVKQRICSQRRRLGKVNG
jgi:hypothetical protein